MRSACAGTRFGCVALLVVAALAASNRPTPKPALKLTVLPTCQPCAGDSGVSQCTDKTECCQDQSKVCYNAQAMNAGTWPAICEKQKRCFTCPAAVTGGYRGDCDCEPGTTRCRKVAPAPAPTPPPTPVAGFACVDAQCVPKAGSTQGKTQCESMCTPQLYVCTANTCTASSTGVSKDVCDANCGHGTVIATAAAPHGHYAQGYYGPPPCRSDERPFQGVGLHGAACAAHCTTAADCPTHTFENATAQPGPCWWWRACVVRCGGGAGLC